MEPDARDTDRIVYGRHPVREALRGRRKVVRIHATDRAAQDCSDILAASDVTVLPALAEDLAKLAGSNDHQGIVAEVEPYPYVDLEDLVDARSTAPLLLCLDQVTDPRNLGAIARVADASGASGIVVTRHGGAGVTAASCKASAGAIEHVRIARCRNLADALDAIKGPRLWTYGLSEHAERVYTDVDLADGVALVLGAEGAGLRPRVRDHCDELLRVPMAGSVASLNVATVAAVLCFEAVRQRAARG